MAPARLEWALPMRTAGSSLVRTLVGRGLDLMGPAGR